MHLLWAVVCLGGSIAAAQGTRIDHRGLREAGPASLPKDDNTRSTLQNRRVAGAVSSLSPRLRKRFPARPRMPRFSKAYWEDWWKRRPEELPDKGNNNHECFINLKRYVWRPSLWRTLGCLQMYAFLSYIFNAREPHR